MAQHTFNVAELFAIRGRGVVVVTDKTYDQLAKNIALKIGDPVEFRQGGKAILHSNVHGIEICDPWSPQQQFAFLLPTDVSKDNLTVGSEVWIDERSLISTARESGR